MDIGSPNAPVLDRIMNEWRSKGGGKDKGKGKGAWERRLVTKPVVEWMEGWTMEQ